MRSGLSSIIVSVGLSAACLVGASAVGAQAPEADHPAKALPIASVEAIDQVWSGHKVGFALAVSATRLYAGYYDANRQLTIAQRDRDATHWTYAKLDTWLGWDSHNYVALAVDPAGRLHVMANMHSEPLIYFRSAESGDARTLRREAQMVGPEDEARVTYPIFLHDAAGRLIVKYRSGRSGAGDEIYNVLNAKTGTWSRLLSTPLVSGEGKRNAYFVGPVLGPDKMFHIVWVWRDTPDASTNHDLSYARSKDLIHWERSDGQPLSLPITLGKAEIVDPVPARGGMINNNTVLGFDSQGRPTITYHKFDAGGDTQVYLARREASGWRTAPISQWKGFRWDFGGPGSLAGRLSVGGARPEAAGRLMAPVIRDGRGLELVLDEKTLAPIEERATQDLVARLGGKVRIPSDMRANVLRGAGGPEGDYALVWPTRPPNRDRPTEDIPPSTTLLLLRLTNTAP
ncbi:BNR repeat-containing protein [Caulobacter segnis]|uniref:BNR repeat-containing protein n=1 Tax=Caulobacter segnis TaxID=88688 RepID=UPI002864BB92|nr:BNR repeat-containing protein [Caulobacter segnis]MDR6625788.1 hypothetical protein [Caulobacter segnis]